MASGFNINTFKSKGLTLGGARPSLFEIIVSTPPGLTVQSGSEEKFKFTARASSIPPLALGTIEVPYFGRREKIAGDRTFPDWQVSVMNDEDYLVRSMFESWSNSINRLESNIRDPNYAAGENSYKVDMTINHYSKDGPLIREYTMIGAWPSLVDAMELNWDAQNQIQTFNVTFSYDYWLPANETTNSYLGAATSPISS